MKKINRISILMILVTMIWIGSLSCGQGGGDMVAQEEYDALKAQLSDAETKIAQLQLAAAVKPTETTGDQTLKDEIAALQAKTDDLGKQITALNNVNEGLTKEKAALAAGYEELNTKYQELQQKLAELTKPVVITEELVENEIFRLINQERLKAGVTELQLGQYLYQQAKQNSRSMESLRKFVYDPAVFYQENFWAAGYDSVEAITHGVLLTWQANEYNFEHGALLPGNKYGAVGAYKSGEIVYITFMAAPFQ
jgi:uncharacterized protein YkwD